MPRIVRAALVQAEWTGDHESMILNNERYAREAANDRAQVLRFQEICSAPYFCTGQDRRCFSYAEEMPGPTTECMPRPARAAS